MLPALRLYTKFVVAGTFLLLLAGGMVTSTGSGLAVPDWPRSFGQWMPAMEGGVLYEHGHRMIAATIGLLILIETLWLWRAEPRRGVRTLGWLAAAGVIAQALLGGLTVRLGLPDAVSIAHAALAEVVFGLTVAIAVATSRSWSEAGERTLDTGVPTLCSLGIGTAALVYAQILLGAVVRHTGAGLAIPDFPLAFGRVVPPLGSLPVALHFAHRVGAVVVALAVGWAAARVRRSHGGNPRLLRPTLLLAALVVLQIGLGGWTVLSYKAAWVATAHLGIGALIWATALVLALRARHLLRPAPAPAHAPIRPLVEVGETR